MSCKVYLDNYSGQYYPGSVIQGRVICNFNSETSLRGIKVRVKGHEHTEWMGTESYYNSESNKHENRNVLFVGDNDVFFQEILVYGAGHGTTSLSVGQHIYPFSVSLPPTIPSSYSCPNGSIDYKIEALADLPMKSDYEDTTLIMVVAPIDLQRLPPDLMQPSSYSDDKTICCLCCASGPISLDVEVPKRVVLPGEVLNVKARITNMSNSNIDSLSLELDQMITCKANTPSSDEKTEKNLLYKVSKPGVGAHGDNTYNLDVEIPTNVQVPNFQNCKLFSAEYKAVVNCSLPSFHHDLSIKFYLEVGNIGIGDTNSSIANQNPGYIPNPPNQPYLPPSGPPMGYPPQGGYPPNPSPMGYPQNPPQNEYYQQNPAQGGGGIYPPMQGYPTNNYPPPNQSLGYPPPNTTFPPYPGGPAASPYPTGPYPGVATSSPSAPPSGPTDVHPKALEAAQGGQPSNPSELPPPSYDQVSRPQI